MRQLKPTFVAVSWAALVLSSTGATRAQPEPSSTDEPAEESAVDQARALARSALEHLEQHRYEEAVAAARQAEKLYHAPIHLLIVGQGLEGLGRLAEAAEIYDLMVAEKLPSSAHAVFVEAQEKGRVRLKDLSARLPSILVKVEGVPHEAAQVSIDGELLGERTGSAVRVNPGAHTVVVRAEGRVTFEKKLELAEGAGVVLVTAVMRDPRAPAPPPPTPEPVVADEGGNDLGLVGWVLIGGGGALVVAGAITGGLSLAQAGDLEDRCPDRRCGPTDRDDFDTAVALGWTSTVTLIVGGAAAAVGTALLLVGEADDEGDTASVSLELGPAWLGVRGTF